MMRALKCSMGCRRPPSWLVELGELFLWGEHVERSWLLAALWRAGAPGRLVLLSMLGSVAAFAWAAVLPTADTALRPEAVYLALSGLAWLLLLFLTVDLHPLARWAILGQLLYLGLYPVLPLAHHPLFAAFLAALYLRELALLAGSGRARWLLAGLWGLVVSLAGPIGPQLPGGRWLTTLPWLVAAAALALVVLGFRRCPPALSKWAGLAAAGCFVALYGLGLAAAPEALLVQAATSANEVRFFTVFFWMLLGADLVSKSARVGEVLSRLARPLLQPRAGLLLPIVAILAGATGVGLAWLRSEAVTAPRGLLGWSSVALIGTGIAALAWLCRLKAETRQRHAQTLLIRAIQLAFILLTVRQALLGVAGAEEAEAGWWPLLLVGLGLLWDGFGGLAQVTRQRATVLTGGALGSLLLASTALQLAGSPAAEPVLRLYPFFAFLGMIFVALPELLLEAGPAKHLERDRLEALGLVALGAGVAYVPSLVWPDVRAGLGPVVALTLAMLISRKLMPTKPTYGLRAWLSVQLVYGVLAAWAYPLWFNAFFTPFAPVIWETMRQIVETVWGGTWPNWYEQGQQLLDLTARIGPTGQIWLLIGGTVCGLLLGMKSRAAVLAAVGFLYLWTRLLSSNLLS
jgi:hypothetical protein